MSKGLTDVKIKALVANPPPKRMELNEGSVDGLILRIGPRGKPSWTLRFRVKGAGGVTERGTKLNGRKYHRISLGNYPAISLKEARAQASAYLASLSRGEDPIEALEQEATDTRETVAGLIADYLNHAEREFRSWRNGKWIFERHFLPRWKDQPVNLVTLRDARKLVADVQGGADGSLKNGAAAEVRKWGNMLFQWGVREGRVKANPFRDVQAPKLGKRDRYLEMDEARAIWAAADAIDYPWGPAFQLLMLTGCRENEICGARWSWFNGAEMRLLIPGEHYKNGNNFLVALPRPALGILQGLPRWNGGDYIFSTTNGEKPIAGIHRKTVDKLAAAAEVILGNGITHFTLHDLRRTVRTHLSRLRIDEVVAELTIGHTLKGLQARYNLYRFEEEKREALGRWADELILDVPGSISAA
jgi:integrase